MALPSNWFVYENSPAFRGMFDMFEIWSVELTKVRDAAPGVVPQWNALLRFRHTIVTITLIDSQYKKFEPKYLAYLEKLNQLKEG